MSALRAIQRGRPGGSSAGWTLGAGLLAAVLGAVVAHAPAAAAVPLVAVAAAVVVVRLGPSALAAGLLALLPAMVLFDSLEPSLLRTFTAAGAVLLLLVLASPLRVRKPAAVAGAALFVAVLIGQAVYARSSDDLIQVAKDLLLPSMTLVVLSPSGRAILVRWRKVLLFGGVAALVVHLLIVAAGMGSIGTYYGIGERLGYAPAIPHELALLGVIVAAAGVVVPRRFSAQIALFAVGALPATLSGVRSALLAIAVILVALVFRSRFNPRVLATIAAVIGLAFVTGAASTVTARFDRQRQELSSLSSLGSGRGEIWTVAINRWSGEGPGAIVFGAGLRAVNDFELQDLGTSFVGHSDVVELLVDLGIVGLAGYVLLWGGLLTGGLELVILIPILVYALVNGSIEYVGPLTYGLALSAAFAPRRGPPGARP